MPEGKPTSDMQSVLDQYAKFNVPPIEALTPTAAHNAPTSSGVATDIIEYGT